ncbi:MAG TPA: class I SAM-dependent methyltransferase [Terriglobales bacterium]|jgi:SAM-dependent methyltransferase
MAEEKRTTSVVNGRLWGSAAEDWAAFQEGVCRKVYVDAFDRVKLGPGTQYLDAGCGAGMAAQIARERGAQVSGLDASESLLGIARRRVPEGDFRQGELEMLPFEDNSFDLVTGFNSFQYAANPGAALAEAKRVARPGSSVVVMTWGKPEGMEAASLVAALRPLLPAPPPGAPGPFALSEEAALRGFATAAGLEPIEVVDVDCPWMYPDLATAMRGLGSSGVAARAAENSGKAKVDEAHKKALEPFRREDGSYRIGATFRYLMARA